MNTISITIIVLISILIFVSIWIWPISIFIAKNKSKFLLNVFSKKVSIFRDRYISLVCSKFALIDLFLIIISGVLAFIILFIEINNKEYKAIDIVSFSLEIISVMLLLSFSFFIDLSLFKSFKKTIINFNIMEINEFVSNLEKENFFEFIKNSKKYKYFFIKKFLTKIKKDDLYNSRKNTEYRYLIKFIYVFILSINIMKKNKIFDQNSIENERTIKIKNSINLFNQFIDKTFEFIDYKRTYKN